MYEFYCLLHCTAIRSLGRGSNFPHLNLLFSMPPMPPGFGIEPPTPNEQAEPNGVEYGEGNLKVTMVTL